MIEREFEFYKTDTYSMYVTEKTDRRQMSYRYVFL